MLNSFEGYEVQAKFVEPVTRRASSKVRFFFRYPEAEQCSCVVSLCAHNRCRRALADSLEPNTRIHRAGVNSLEF